LDDDDDNEEEEDDLEDKHVTLDKFGNTVRVERKHREGQENDDDQDSAPLPKGNRVRGKYRAEEQFEGVGEWYDGVIDAVKKDGSGNTRYDVLYDDGDYEENMQRKHIKVLSFSKEEEQQQQQGEQHNALAKKRKLAR